MIKIILYILGNIVFRVRETDIDDTTGAFTPEEDADRGTIKFTADVFLLPVHAGVNPTAIIQGNALYTECEIEIPNNTPMIKKFQVSV